LLEAIRPRLPEIVALTGAGGKTTLMLRLAREAREAGLRTLVTVTTKMHHPDAGPIIYDAAELAGKDFAIYASGLDEATGKLLGIAPDAIPDGFDIVLVEADGAAHKPLTAPADHEPVIPPTTTTVVAVAGLDALGQPISAMHRSEVVARLSGESLDSPVTAAVVAAALSHPEGNTKGRPHAAQVIYILNKADDEFVLQQAKQVVGLLEGTTLVTVDGFVVWPQA
jgi:probable selenium-dependent hydroxylase accessory protein YqeC